MDFFSPPYFEIGEDTFEMEPPVSFFEMEPLVLPEQPICSSGDLPTTGIDEALSGLMSIYEMCQGVEEDTVDLFYDRLVGSGAQIQKYHHELIEALKWIQMCIYTTIGRKTNKVSTKRERWRAVFDLVKSTSWEILSERTKELLEPILVDFPTTYAFEWIAFTFENQNLRKYFKGAVAKKSTFKGFVKTLKKIKFPQRQLESLFIQVFKAKLEYFVSKKPDTERVKTFFEVYQKEVKMRYENEDDEEVPFLLNRLVFKTNFDEIYNTADLKNELNSLISLYSLF